MRRQGPHIFYTTDSQMAVASFIHLPDNTTNTLGPHLYHRLSRTQVHSEAGRNRSIEKKIQLPHREWNPLPSGLWQCLNHLPYRVFLKSGLDKYCEYICKCSLARGTKKVCCYCCCCAVNTAIYGTGMWGTTYSGCASVDVPCCLATRINKFDVIERNLIYQQIAKKLL
jgi:hypothetical protein